MDTQQRQLCQRGHELNEQTLYINAKGHRRCRVCNAEYQRNRRRGIPTARIKSLPAVLYIDGKGNITFAIADGVSATISAADHGLLQSTWYVSMGNNYLCRRTGDLVKKSFYMHRVILERMTGRSLSRGEHCDHINRNHYDNRRSNLRIATPIENTRNRGLNSNNTSGVTGVYWNKLLQKWVAQINYDGRLRYLGVFENKADAIATRRKAEGEVFGEYAPVYRD